MKVKLLTRFEAEAKANSRNKIPEWLKKLGDEVKHLKNMKAILPLIPLLTSCMAYVKPYAYPEERREWPNLTDMRTYAVKTKEHGWVYLKGYETRSPIFIANRYTLYTATGLKASSYAPRHTTIIYESCILPGVDKGWIIRKPSNGPWASIEIEEVKRLPHWRKDVFDREREKAELARQFPSKRLPVFEFKYGENSMELTPFEVKKRKLGPFTLGYTLRFKVNYHELMGAEKNSAVYNSGTYVVEVHTDSRLNVNGVVVYDIGGVVVADSRNPERKVPIPLIQHKGWYSPTAKETAESAK